MNNTLLAALVAIASVAGLGAGLAGSGILVGMAGVALIVLIVALSLRVPGRPSALVVALLAAWGSAFCGLIVLSYRLHDPSGPLATIGGFPVATAMLVYGITPIGIAMGVLYGLAFEREILPLDKQREFLGQFGKK